MVCLYVCEKLRDRQRQRETETETRDRQTYGEKQREIERHRQIIHKYPVVLKVVLNKINTKRNPHLTSIL